jgi:hypothetical protein
MKVASTCRADEVKVRLYFLVNVLKARGLKVAGGNIIGRMLAFGAAAAELKDLIGCTGVPKAGDDDGIRFETGFNPALNIGAGFRFSA